MNILRGILAVPFLALGIVAALIVIIPVMLALLFWDTGQLIAGRTLFSLKTNVEFSDSDGD